MKNSFFTLAIVTLLFSCSGPSETAYTPTEVIDSLKVVKTEETNYSITPTDFLSFPFTVSVMSDEKWDVNKKIEANKHEQNLNDTILTMRFKESLLHIHNHNLVDGYIVNNEINLAKNIHVGMSKDSFFLIFKHLENHKDAPFIDIKPSAVKIGCCSEQNDMWTFRFDADTIFEIDYTGYVD